MTSNYQPSNRRAAATKAEQKIKRSFEIWDDFNDEMEEEESAPTLFETEDLDIDDKKNTERSSTNLKEKHHAEASSRAHNKNSSSMLDNEDNSGRDLQHDHSDEQDASLTAAELSEIKKREAHERLIQRLTHERRRAARNVHSSDKLELSRRMTYKMFHGAPPDAPQYSPLKCVNLVSRKEMSRLSRSPAISVEKIL